jgi:FkbM family methyltransferase
MKLRLKALLQRVLGLEMYLFLFSLFKIVTLKWDRVEGDFNYLVSLIDDTGVAIDAGANIGIMTVLFARKLRNGVVYAFEPMPLNFVTLQKIIAWFGLKNVVAYDYALGDETKQVEMVMPVNGSVRLQGISHVVQKDEHTEGDRVRVACKRLDDVDMLFASQIRITAIKIDVEGYEYFVLNGARRLINTYRPIIYCELTANDHYQKCLDLLVELKYDIKVLKDNNLDLFDPKTHLIQGNFFFIPQSSANTDTANL